MKNIKCSIISLFFAITSCNIHSSTHESHEFVYWQPITTQAIETQLQEVIDIDKQIAESDKASKSIINKITGKSSTYKKQGDELAAQADTKETICLEQAIPPLMQQRDRNILAHPSHLRNNPLITFVMSPTYEEPDDETDINKGPYYNALQIIKNYYPALHNIPIYLKFRNIETSGNELALNGIDKKTGNRKISILANFLQISDSHKLHTLLHELEHILYNDANHRFIRKFDNKNELTDLAITPLLHNTLQSNNDTISINIDRYCEWRCDKEALLAIQCPYCLLELAVETFHNERQSSSTSGLFNPKGYFETWQMLPQINKLYNKETICKHHIDNNKNIDLSITDGSSLENRLHIIHNQPTALEDRKTIILPK